MSHGGNAGVGPGTPTLADMDAAQLWTSSFDVNTTASDSYKQLNESAPPIHTDSIVDRPASLSFTNDLRASHSSSTRPMKAECPPEFNHPAAVEEQRIIWLPKDRLGLVLVLEQELASHDILCSSEGAEMDSQGKVTVTSASPEDVRRTPVPRPCEGEGNEEGILSLWDMMNVVVKYAARLTR